MDWFLYVENTDVLNTFYKELRIKNLDPTFHSTANSVRFWELIEVKSKISNYTVAIHICFCLARSKPVQM